jgi:hypothetical protein
MINRMVTALLSVGLAGLVGCASAPRLMWVNPGAGTQEFARDRYACARENPLPPAPPAPVQIYPPQRRQPATGYGAIISGMGDISPETVQAIQEGRRQQAAEDLFRYCMEARGWRLVPRPSE